MANNLITVDLGGTKILSALLDETNKIVHTEKIATDVSQGADFIVESIAGTVKAILENTQKTESDISAICLGVPGTVNPNTGIIGNAPNLNIVEYNIKEALQGYFSIPVLIENDVNLAALGIKTFEFDNDVNNMLVVFVGTGIGGALLFDGKMYRGSSFFAGEIGHMVVDDKGKFASGKGNTFENLASRKALVKAIKKDMKKGEPTVLNDIVPSKKAIKSKALASAIAQKDKLVTKHLTESCEIIGTVLASVTTLLNVDTIVLGGGVVEAMDDFMIPKIQKAFSKAVLREPGEIVKIVATKLGDDAPLFGGRALADEFLGK